MSFIDCDSNGTLQNVQMFDVFFEKSDLYLIWMIHQNQSVSGELPLEVETNLPIEDRPNDYVDEGIRPCLKRYSVIYNNWMLGFLAFDSKKSTSGPCLCERYSFHLNAFGKRSSSPLFGSFQVYQVLQRRPRQEIPLGTW